MPRNKVMISCSFLFSGTAKLVLSLCDATTCRRWGRIVEEIRQEMMTLNSKEDFGWTSGRAAQP